MNVHQLTNFAQRQAASKGISHQATHDAFFFEHFLRRLSLSKYSESFVFKGGFLLGSIVGLEKRTTLDMDLEYQGANLSKDEIYRIIEEICNEDIDDAVDYLIVSVNEIMEEQKYSGISVRIKGTFGNLKKIFSLDIANNDPITPFPDLYEYKSKFNESSFKILSYNIETILAEKFHTTIAKGVRNSRSKDLYDIFLLVSENDYDSDILHDAIVNTFRFRKTNIKKEYIKTILEMIKTSKIQKERFENYVKKSKYIKEITFNDVMDACDKLFNIIKYIDYQFNEDIEIRLIRHGEDEKGKLGGWSTLRLTDNGKEQIQTLAESIILKEAGFDLIIASDLERGKETAIILSNILNITAIYSDGLREINNGDLANLTIEEFNKKYHGLYFASLRFNQKYPGGESPEDFFIRVKDCFFNIIQNHKSKKVLVVTHGGVIGIIESIINGVGWSNRQKYDIKFAESFKLTIKNGIAVLEENVSRQV